MTGPFSRTSSVVCRGVVSSRTIACVRPTAVVSFRGPVRIRCSSSSVSMSP